MTNEKLLIFFFLILLIQTSNCLLFAKHSLGRQSLERSMSTFNDGGEDDVIGSAVPVLPTISSTHNMKSEKPKNIPYDLWVVGAGTLGELVCKSYKHQFPSAVVIAETATPSRHEQLRSYGVEPRLRSERTEKDAKLSKNVVICTPPSSSKDYVGEVNDAIRLWCGPMGEGNLIFTSSIAVYGDSNGNIVDENFRLDTRSNRTTILIAAEEAIILRQGNVIRLAGLYNDFRGPHTYWMKLASEGKTIDTNADGIVNLIHYEDAASLVLTTILTGLKSTVFLGVDNDAVTKEEICRSALASKLFPNNKLPQFKTTEGPIGKRCNGQLTRSLLKWKPQYPSFRTYMRRLGGEVFPEKEQKQTTKLITGLDDVDDVVFDIPELESAENTKQKKNKAKSALWLPGDDDDDGF